MQYGQYCRYLTLMKCMLLYMHSSGDFILPAPSARRFPPPSDIIEDLMDTFCLPRLRWCSSSCMVLTCWVLNDESNYQKPVLLTSKTCYIHSKVIVISLVSKNCINKVGGVFFPPHKFSACCTLMLALLKYIICTSIVVLSFPVCKSNFITHHSSQHPYHLSILSISQQCLRPLP